MTMMDGGSNNDCSVEKLHQKLQQLQQDGITKRQRRQGELEKLTQTRDELHQKWLGKGRLIANERPLHAYMKAVTSVNHLVPSTVLSKKAKLAQSLHLMEVFLQQKALIEKQKKEQQYAESLCHQAAEQEDLQSEASLKLMNELCTVDSTIQAMKEEMKDMGFNVEQEEESVKSKELQEESHESSSSESLPIKKESEAKH